jgi:hypothetical protein
MKKPTDLTVLRALLDAGKKHLSENETKAFSGMLRDMEAGIIVRLSKPQRAWAEAKYNHLNLDRAYVNEAPPPGKKRKGAPTGPLGELPWAHLGMPDKPPGR